MSFSNAPERAAGLVDAARARAEASGEAAFTAAADAERAGCSLKGFYACFASKDDLLVALLAAESALGAQILGPAIEAAPDRLQGFVTGIFDMASLPWARGYARVLVQEHRRLAEARTGELDAALAPLVDMLTEIVGDARDARTVFGLILSGLHDVALGRTDAGDAVEYLCRFCAGALSGVRQ